MRLVPMILEQSFIEDKAYETSKPATYTARVISPYVVICNIEVCTI